jgi:hypothetical protein
VLERAVWLEREMRKRHEFLRQFAVEMEVKQRSNLKKLNVKMLC